VIAFDCSIEFESGQSNKKGKSKQKAEQQAAKKALQSL